MRERERERERETPRELPDPASRGRGRERERPHENCSTRPREREAPRAEVWARFARGVAGRCARAAPARPRPSPCATKWAVDPDSDGADPSRIRADSCRAWHGASPGRRRRRATAWRPSLVLAGGVDPPRLPERRGSGARGGLGRGAGRAHAMACRWLVCGPMAASRQARGSGRDRDGPSRDRDVIVVVIVMARYEP